MDQSWLGEATLGLVDEPIAATHGKNMQILAEGDGSANDEELKVCSSRIGLSEEPEVSASDMVRLLQGTQARKPGSIFLTASPHGPGERQVSRFPKVCHVLVRMKKLPPRRQSSDHLSWEAAVSLKKRLISAQ
nr:hypothetical protein Iba_chr06bCG6880 [Ipomoea batatas]